MTAVEHTAIRPIRRTGLLSLLHTARPSFSTDETTELPYLLPREFADHLLALYGRNPKGDFPAVIKLIERLHPEGDAYVREAATIGLPEDIQNLWMSHRIDPEEFGRLLLPVGRKGWDSLDAFWDGKISMVGADP
jgi:hypothetical protein